MFDTLINIINNVMTAIVTLAIGITITIQNNGVKLTV
jgi:hypothetical protein